MSRTYERNYGTLSSRHHTTQKLPGVKLRYGGILQNSNPWDAAEKLFGDGFIKDGRTEVERMCRANAQAAKTVGDRIRAWLPSLESMGWSGAGHLKWTQEALNDIASYAREQGALQMPATAALTGVTPDVLETANGTPHGATLGYILRQLAIGALDTQLADSLKSVPYQPQPQAA
jgi:hypothetical protein